MNLRHGSPLNMKRRTFMQSALTAGLSLSAIEALVACGGAPTQQNNVVTVTDAPDVTDAIGNALFKKLSSAFHSKYPQYKVVAHDYRFKPDDFYTRFNANQAEDLSRVFLTEAHYIIQKQYAADVSDALHKWRYFRDISSFVLEEIADNTGRLFAIPKAGYKLALLYRRDMFKAAGLNPDKPPLTWDEFRAYARQVTQKINLSPWGYNMQTLDNMGGWMFTNWLYSAGGQVEKQDSDGKWQCVANSEQGYAVLQLLHDMRWKDGSIGPQNRVNADNVYSSLGNANAAMMIATIDNVAGECNRFEVPAGTYGIGPVPTNGANACLAGGDIWIVNPHADSDIQKMAAQYALLSLEPEFYEAEIKANKAQNKKLLVGYNDPGFFGGTYLQQFHTIDAKYVNIPASIYQPYFDANQQGQHEPIIQSQDWYERMDDVLQKVLGTQDLDLKTTLDETVEKFQREVLDPINKGS